MTKRDIEIFIEEVNKKGAGHAQQTKIRLKAFFRYLYNTDDFPDIVKWISTKKSTRHRKPRKKILTIEERKAPLNACKSQRDRALITFLDHTGCRAEECVMTTIGDIKPDKQGRFLTITLGSGKTGRRRRKFTEPRTNHVS